LISTPTHAGLRAWQQLCASNRSLADTATRELARVSVQPAALLAVAKVRNIDFQQAVSLMTKVRTLVGRTDTFATDRLRTFAREHDFEKAREPVRQLMSQYRLAPTVKSPLVQKIVVAEVDRARAAELNLLRLEGQMPADVQNGSATPDDVVARTLSTSRYAQYLARHPERFASIANRTVHLEDRFQALVKEADSTLLGERQFNAIEAEKDPLRKAYLTQRSLSVATDALQKEWVARADGASPTPSSHRYSDAMSFLSDVSVSDDDRYTDRAADRPNEELHALIRPEWGTEIPLGQRAQRRRSELTEQARILDEVNGVERRLMIMNQTGQRDMDLLSRSMRSLDTQVAHLRPIAARDSSMSGLSPYVARQALAFVEPLRNRVQAMVRGGQ
jgi:hypothetical protein